MHVRGQSSESGRSGSYTERLGKAGRYLDQNGLHSINLFEIDDALIARAMCGDEREPKLLEFAGGSSPPPVAPVDTDRPTPTVSPLTGYGYVSFLEALGRRLDLQQATEITLVEGTNFVAVGWRRAGSTERESCEELLLAADIDALMEQTYSPAATRNPEQLGSRERARMDKRRTTVSGAVRRLIRR